VSEKLRTLIVEDSPIILENLQALLEEIDEVEVVGTFASESAVCDWLDSRTDACDVAIIDVFLASGNGLGVLRHMDKFAPPPERVVLTNYATAEMRARCKALGAEAVFDKSTEIEALLEWVHSRVGH
jgi:DNA-binding NarL/FixJ family response regulator